jgi:ferric-dicitrate binding protein FerR (iron transport regulator)
MIDEMEELIKRYLNGIASDEDKMLLLSWLRIKGNVEEFNQLKTQWVNEKEYEVLSEKEQIGLIRFQGYILKKSHDKGLKINSYYRFLRYAAVLLFVISVGGGLVLFGNLYKLNQKTVFTSVADGGQVSKVILPDSSIVWINSESRLSYDQLYGKKNRSVVLDGQAFFQVNKNKKLPFIVKSNNLNVEVIGTKFDVEAYPDSPTTTVILQEGTVNVSLNQNLSKSITLKPGEQYSFNSVSKKSVVTKTNVLKLVSWKEGVLNIYDLPLTETIKKLERRYNYKFSLDENVEDLNVTMTLKNEDLTSVLQILKTIIPVSISTKNDSIYIKSRK